MIVYLDTSAALKMVLQEVESTAVEAYTAASTDTFVSSWLLHTEMHCAAARQGYAASPRLEEVLARVELTDVERSDLRAAASLPGRLRSADAIHLATASRIQARAMLVYDNELAEAAQAVGLQVIAPR